MDHVAGNSFEQSALRLDRGPQGKCQRFLGEGPGKWTSKVMVFEN